MQWIINTKWGLRDKSYLGVKWGKKLLNMHVKRQALPDILVSTDYSGEIELVGSYYNTFI